jgi:hypothetical protein
MPWVSKDWNKFRLRRLQSTTVQNVQRKNCCWPWDFNKISKSLAKASHCRGVKLSHAH